ncbi:methanogenesis marker 16 metalloprotein [Methanothrix sp.]|jgi:putative methanogenesis marker 16 metalloprotein|uniref:methanogenesis marker 16 metalloprotein n=1 Tax=Methanothrix sp. TaxID=90426 RepID=UPI001BD44AC3
MIRRIEDIKERIKCGRAVVLTQPEISRMLEERGEVSLKDVDVVTTATRAVMSGTYAVLSFPLAAPGSFIRASSARINGVPAWPGPCPNERLGMIDLMVYGTSHSIYQPEYGGGHLFRELVEGGEAVVEAESEDGKVIERSIRLEEIPYARIFSTRNAFKNYVAFVNPRSLPLKSIFSRIEFPPHLAAATVSGCGQINPVKNDPYLETIGIGTRILLNGAQGFVVGKGTRSLPTRPNLLGLADMHQMDPEYMGGFLTSAGPECIGSWAVPIPVLNETILNAILQQDRDIPLTIMDVNVRQKIGKSSYGDVWDSVDLRVRFDPERCRGCSVCTAEPVCPMRAILIEDGRVMRDEERCFNCGLCVSQCSGGAFQGRLGAIHLGERTVPIQLRQSDRARAVKLAERLKEEILDGSFGLTEMVERL